MEDTSIEARVVHVPRGTVYSGRPGVGEVDVSLSNDVGEVAPYLRYCTDAYGDVDGNDEMADQSGMAEEQFHPY